MACGYCGKNQAVKTYEEIKNGKKQTEYYCLDCYHRLFLYADGAESDLTLSACPYCGMSVAEFKKTNLVGCANCYKVMSGDLFPSVVKMQGVKAHRGKTPPLGEFDVGLFDDFREEQEKKARFRKQCNELEIIIAKLQAENNFEDAKGYADKLSLMRNTLTVEEEFVWRTRQTLSKR